MTAVAISLSVVAAGLTHAGVRAVNSTKRRLLSAFALVMLGAGLWFGRSFGGFWPGFYTILSIYFLTTVVTPWIVFLYERRHDR
ncbi:MAG: hypothetical protein AAF662_09955 [Pseudomonadota bacterium]